MVWDPPKKSVNVTRMIIYSFIPILAIYAGWRIQKFWVLLGIGLLVGYGLSIPLALIMVTYPEYSVVPYIISIGANIVINIIVVKHFARKYNEKIVSKT